MKSEKKFKKLKNILKSMPVFWDGKNAILEMKKANYSHWRQMEWIGFYFQFLCNVKLFSIMKMPGPKYGRVEFDGLFNVPWDFKVHPINDSKGKENRNVVINDKEAIEKAIKKFNNVGLILAVGDAIYNDKNRSFQNWHKKLKGGLSNYEKERILRKAPSRLRKTAFYLREIYLILLNKEIIKSLSTFQKGFRNSNGNPRRAKILLDLNKTKSIEIIKF